MEVTNKELLLRLMDKVDGVIDTQASHTGDIKATIAHTKETNGKVAQVIKDLEETKLSIFTEDEKLFQKLVRYGGVTLVVSAFLFIKETRDVIIGLFKLFI